MAALFEQTVRESAAAASNAPVSAILSAEHTAALLPYRQLVPALRQAASDLRSGALLAPHRLTVAGNDGAVMCMPALAGDIGIVKTITVHPENRHKGLPSIQGEVVIFDAATGRRLAWLDAATVTARRTAALSLLGIERVGPAKTDRVLLIGTGAQAHAHADAFAEHLGIRHFGIAARDVDKARSFTADLTARFAHVDAQAIDLSALDRSALAGYDVVVALTSALSPVVPEHVPAETLVIGVGAYRPDMAEIPASLLHRRRIIVDHLPGARTEAGDLIRAGIDWDSVIDFAEPELPAGAGNGWVVKTVGHASWDLAAARTAIASLAD